MMLMSLDTPWPLESSHYSKLQKKAQNVVAADVRAKSGGSESSAASPLEITARLVWQKEQGLHGGPEEGPSNDAGAAGGGGEAERKRVEGKEEELQGTAGEERERMEGVEDGEGIERAQSQNWSKLRTAALSPATLFHQTVQLEIKRVRKRVVSYL